MGGESPKSSVRDASQIAVSLALLGILISPFAILFCIPFYPVIEKYTTPTDSTIAILGTAAIPWACGFALITRRYIKIARTWPTERRGNHWLHAVEGILALVSLVPELGIVQIGKFPIADWQVFLGALIILLTACHLLVFLLLKYRIRLPEILTWGISGTVACHEVQKHLL